MDILLRKETGKQRIPNYMHGKAALSDKKGEFI